MDLSEFLLARIAEDEAAATNRGQLAGDQWSALEPDRASDVSVAVVGRGRGVVVSALRWEAGHIARWDPARVLAECEAKRRIVEAYLDVRTRRDIYESADARAVEDDEQVTARRSAAARTRGLEIALEALTAPYADHPDYDEDWKV